LLNLGSLKTNLKEIQSIGNSLRNNNNEGNLYKKVVGFLGDDEAEKRLKSKARLKYIDKYRFF